MKNEKWEWESGMKREREKETRAIANNGEQSKGSLKTTLQR